MNTLALTTAALLFQFILIGYLLATTSIRAVVYFSIIVLALLSIIGVVLKILHLPGADELLLTTFSAPLLGGIALLWKAFVNQHKQVLVLHLAAGLLLIIPLILAVTIPDLLATYVLMIELALAAITGLMLWTDRAQSSEEKNILILFLCKALIAIIAGIK